MSLKQELKAEAHRLGFQLAGITPPGPPLHFSVFENWLRAGRHGEMSYLATEQSRQRRADPRNILPDCRSILVVGIRYAAPNLSKEDNYQSIVGQIAAYAWGNDYHQVLPMRLRALASFVENKVGKAVPNRVYSDTGSILERDMGQRAGLGWIGKNTCLISPGLGSYFLLAEVLLGIEMEPDQAFTADFCGTCTRCLEACPTGCILPDRTLDASRCISYLTIELKGSIPPVLRKGIGAWIFGCDVCQQVCPWNLRFATPHGDADFEPNTGNPHPDLLQELNLSALSFNSKFKNSPVKRAKRRGYLRNVIVALVNAVNKDVNHQNQIVRALSQVLFQEAEPLVRSHAAWALGEMGGEAAHRDLRRAAKLETDESTLAEILTAIECYNIIQT